MPNIRQIVIGPSPEHPAFVLRRGAELARFKDIGQEQERNGSVGRALAALHGLPDLLLSGYAHSTNLLEVQIHGDLVRAADGVGYRAFAMGDRGIVEQAKLFDPSSLTALINVAMLWRLASIMVAQKHLADISATLKSIEKGVSHIAQFQRDEQASKIESAFEYLRQVEYALADGERESAVRHRLEAIEADMDAIQRHLVKLFESRLGRRIKHDNMFGYSDIEEGFPVKLEELQKLLWEHRLAGWTRVGAFQMVSEFPGVTGLLAARAKALEAAAAQNQSMCRRLEQVMPDEVSQWSGRAEAGLTNVGELVTGRSKWHKLTMEKILPASIQATDQHWSLRRAANESATPKLDALKRVSLFRIQQAASAEVRSAGRLVSATTSLDCLAREAEAPKRYLVEWGKTGPNRILQIPDIGAKAG